MSLTFFFYRTYRWFQSLKPAKKSVVWFRSTWRIIQTWLITLFLYYVLMILLWSTWGGIIGQSIRTVCDLLENLISRYNCKSNTRNIMVVLGAGSAIWCATHSYFWSWYSEVPVGVHQNLSRTSFYQRNVGHRVREVLPWTAHKILDHEHSLYLELLIKKRLCYMLSMIRN